MPLMQICFCKQSKKDCLSNVCWKFGVFSCLFDTKEFMFMQTILKKFNHTGEGNGNLLQYSCLENIMD